MKPGTEALRQLPALGECDANLLGRLNEVADLVRVGPDEELFREGEILDELMFLTVGQVGAVHTHSGGKQNLVDVIQPVRPLCLPAALLGLPAPAAARTVTTARLIAVPVSDLRVMIRNDTALGQRLLDYSLTETQMLTQEIYALKIRPAVQRLAIYLLGRVNEGGAQSGPLRAAVREAIAGRQDRLLAGEPVSRFRGTPARRGRDAARDRGVTGSARVACICSPSRACPNEVRPLGRSGGAFDRPVVEKTLHHSKSRAASNRQAAEFS